MAYVNYRSLLYSSLGDIVKHLFRFLALAIIIVTVTTLVGVRPTAAGTSPCGIASGTLLNGQSTGPIPVPAGKVYRFTFSGASNGFFIFTPPGSGGVLNLSGGTVFWALTDETSDCQPAQFFNPGDARTDGRPGDRIVVYCNTSANPATLDVWGVTNNSLGQRLYKFNFADLVAAGPKGILKKVEPLGSVSARVDANNNFVVQWFGGPAGATGTKDFAKSFKCDFKR
jgi:hypothetical protein